MKQENKSLNKSMEESMISVDTEQKLSHAINLLEKVAATINLNAIAGTVKACGEHLGLLKICLKAANERDPNNHAKHASLIVEHVKSKNQKSGQNADIDSDLATNALETRYDCYAVALDCLDSVFKTIEKTTNNGVQGSNYDTVLTRKVENLWRFCLESKDQLWHYSLYDYLNNNLIHRSRLTRLDTPFIQNWFDYAAQEAPETNALLYAEWLESAERYSDASKILYKLATLDSANSPACVQSTYSDPNSANPNNNKITFDLSYRIQLLSKSLADAKASSDSELVAEVNDRLDVAELQQTVLKLLKHKIQSSADNENLEDYEQGILHAESKLISLSQLYRAYGELLNMPEVQLLVLHCAGQGDGDVIDHLWRVTIDGCLQDEKGAYKYDLNDSELCVPALKEKVLFLTRTFLTSRSSAQNLESLQHSNKYI